MTACARGAHLLAHGPRAVLTDWLAWPLVGAEAESLTARSRATLGVGAPLLATWLAARSRFTEDWLAGSNAAQYVILGAGLDSFAWRQTGRLRVYEVDHPATEDWKRSRLDALGVAAPPELVWAPVDLFHSIAVHAGEPPLTRSAPEQFAELLAEHGFEVHDRVGYADVEPRWGLPALSIANEQVVLAVKRE
jgi:methyltransferase (TIGR00027 family)